MMNDCGLFIRKYREYRGSDGCKGDKTLDLTTIPSNTPDKVCPREINAATFFLPIHTQHIISFPTSPSQPSDSANSLINDRRPLCCHRSCGLAPFPSSLSARPTSLLLPSVIRLCLSAAGTNLTHVVFFVLVFVFTVAYVNRV